MEILNGTPATYDDLVSVIERARDEDRLELSCLGDLSAVLSELLPSALVGRVNGEAAVVYGVRPPEHPLDFATLWMVTSPLVEMARTALARRSRRFVADTLATYGFVGGYVIESNLRSRRWLTWMEFSLSEPYEIEPVGLARRFEKWL